MSRTTSRRLSFSLIVAVTLLYSTLVWSQSTAVAPEHRRAMVAAADYVSISSSLTDRLLKSYGYTPPTTAADWRRVAPIRKLELAYVAAAHADPQHGGDRFLALLAQDLAQRYDSVRQGPLAKYVDKPRHTVTFRHPDVLPAKIDLPPAVRSAVRAAAQYCTYGIDPARILVEDLGVATNAEAQDLLSRSNTIDDAFTDALARHDSGEQHKRVAAVAKRLDEKYGTPAYDRRLAPFLPKNDIAGSTAPPPVFEPPSPRTPPWTSPGGLPHSRPPAATRNAESTYSEVRSSWVAERVPTSFAAASVIVEGGGGILFGNSVRDTGLPAVKTLKYAARTASAGDVVVTFADGSHAMLPDVTAEEAYAAKAILFDGAGRLKGDPDDAAVVLVSMNANLDYLECGADKSEYYGRAFDMIVHPALAHTNLGWSAIIVDMYPSIVREIRDQQKELGKTAAALPTFVRDLRANHAYNWKIVDVPILVERSADRLELRRDPNDGDFPEGLSRVAFLEMRPFYDPDKPKPDMDFARDFYAQLPAIARRVPEYWQINSFAQVLAVFRWAKAKGAHLEGTITAPNSAHAPEAVAVVRGTLKPVKPPTDEELEYGMNRCVAQTPRRPQ